LIVLTAMASDSVPPAGQTVETSWEQLAKTRELDIYEREVAAKEAELSRSPWSPTAITVFIAMLALVGNLIALVVNNWNLQKVERIRSQSNITLEAIRTGNPETACKNLLTFINLGLVDDAEKTIRHNCETSPASGPSLPVNLGITSPTSFTTGQFLDAVNNVIRGVVLDADTHQPIGDVAVSVPAASLSAQTDAKGQFVMTLPKNTMLPFGTVLNAEKPGYETLQQPEALLAGTSLTVELHRTK
jgi:hypothetical protein